MTQFKLRAPHRDELTRGQQRQLELDGWRWCKGCDRPYWSDAHARVCRGPQPVDADATPWGLLTPEVSTKRLSPELLALLPYDLWDIYQRGWVCKWEPAELEALVIRVLHARSTA